MEIYVLVKENQLNVLKKIISNLEFIFDEVSYYTNTHDFYIDVGLAEKGRLDFVMIDFSFIQLDICNPYELMKQAQNPVPVCIYNDPYPLPQDRSAYWIAKNRDYFRDIIDLECISNLYSIFYLISNQLEKNDINPYLSLISHPKKLLSSREEKQILDFDLIRKKGKLLPSRLKLLELLYKNKEKSISEKTVCEFLWNRYDFQVRQYLYTYVYDIRKVLEKVYSNRVSLEKCSLGNYRLKFNDEAEDIKAENEMPKYKSIQELFNRSEQLINEFTKEFETDEKCEENAAVFY